MMWFVALAGAHVPNIASYALVEDDAGWHLDVALSTDGMHSALRQAYPNEALSESSVEAYERLLIAHLRRGIAISYDGEPAVLGRPAVQLAPHETRVQFVITAPPDDLLVVGARIDALSETAHQNNVFRVTSYTAREHVVLSEDNGFEGSVYVGMAPEPDASIWSWWP